MELLERETRNKAMDDRTRNQSERRHLSIHRSTWELCSLRTEQRVATSPNDFLVQACIKLIQDNVGASPEAVRELGSAANELHCSSKIQQKVTIPQRYWEQLCNLSEKGSVSALVDLAVLRYSSWIDHNLIHQE